MADYLLLETGDYLLLEDGTYKLLLDTDNSICWGHDTAVEEDTIHDFNILWTGDGFVAGAGDAEKLYVRSYMESETWNIGARRIKITIDKYGAGGVGESSIKIKDGASQAACEADSWEDYVGPYVSAGWVKVRIET